METEAKAKIVASVWGAKFVQFLAALAVLPWSILKKRLNSSFFQSDRGKTEIEQFLPTKQNFAFSSNSNLLLCNVQ